MTTHQTTGSSPEPKSVESTSSGLDLSATPSGTGRIGRYRLVRPLSKGGMAEVYEGRRESLAGVSPRVAIKVILPEHAKSRDFKDLFVNEARLGASMHHTNLVQIQDFDQVDGIYFIVMEYVEGFTIRRVMALAERAGLEVPLGVIAEIGRQACDGLHYAHTAHDEEGRPLNLVHRDIKPSNLILGPHGVVKVLDFGISKGRLREEKKGAVRGTWGYMAPEQAAGRDVGPTCDLFGLATVLYELAALQPMFGDSGKEEIRRMLAEDHAARMAATLDGPKYGPLIGVLVRALQRDPAARYEHAEAFGRALAGLVPDPVTARDELTRFYEQIAEVQASLPQGTRSVAEPTASPDRSGPQIDFGGVAAFAGGITASLGVAGALLAVGGLLWWTRPQDPNRQVVVDERLEHPAIAAGTPIRTAPAPVEVAPAPRPAPRRPSERELAAGEIAARLFDAARPPPPDILVEPLAPSGPGENGASPGAPTEEAEAIAATPAVAEGPVLGPSVTLVGRTPPQATEVFFDAKQRAEVYVDGRFVDYTPFKGMLPFGSHQITLVAEDGRIETFDVMVSEGERVRRTYDFDRGEFR